MRAAQDTAETEADLVAPPIRPWRSLLICAALVALALALLRDLGITDQQSLVEAWADLRHYAEQTISAAATEPPEVTSAADVLPPPEAGTSPVAASGGTTFLARIIGDPVRLVFAAACCATLLFILVQLVSLAIDTRLVGKRSNRAGLLTPLAHVVRAFAARRLRLGQPEQRRMDALLLATEGDIVADPLRLGLTAYPMLGFLGTVVGLSGAIETLPNAIGNPDALRPVLTELHVAFDTTLLGLIGALICLVGARMLDGAWDRLARHASQG